MLLSLGAAGVGLGLGEGVGLGLGVGLGTGVGVGVAVGCGSPVGVEPSMPEPPHPAVIARMNESARTQYEENRSRGFNS